MRQKIVEYRRKRKTNYRKRLSLLMSKKPRLVVRKSLKNINVQVVEYNPEGDRVVVSVNSKKLAEFGWNMSKKNIPSAYLLGLLAGKEAKKHNITEVVLDIGLNTPVKGSRIFAVLKGVIDMGIKVPHTDTIFPSEDRIKGNHIAGFIKKSSELGLKNQFLIYSKNKVTGETIIKKFEEVKNKIKV